MRIVLDLQTAQAALASGDAYGQSAIAFAQALVRNRGAHEILIVLSDQFQATIDPIRAAFFSLLPNQNIRIWRSPNWGEPGEPNHPWRRQAAAAIREAFLVSLEPDLVHLTWPFGLGDNIPTISIGTFTQTLLTAVTVLDAIALSESNLPVNPALKATGLRQLDHIKRAHLWLTATDALQHDVAQTLGLPLDRVINLNIVNSALGLNTSEQSDNWDALANQVFQSFERLLHTQPPAQIARNLSCRPKMAYVSPLPPVKSGIAEYSAELLPELSRHYEIDVIVAQDTVSDPWINANYAVRDVAWFETYAHQYDRVLYHIGNSPYHQYIFDLLAKVPGVVVLHDFFLGHIVEGINVEGPNPQNWIRELYHSHGYVAVQERFYARIVSDVAFKYPCNLSVFQQALGVIVHSNFACDLAEQWYGKGWAQSWGVIPMLRVPATPIDRCAARQALGLADDAFVVCSVGLLGSIKQNHRLLQSWLNSDLAKDTKAQLIFVGENPEDDYGKTILKIIDSSAFPEKIQITGWVDDAGFRDYLAAADIAVQLRSSSRGETSAAVLDCLNYGLPTIVNACGAIAELAPDTVWMLPDDFADAELTQALNVLWKNPDKRQVLGENALKTIRTFHRPRDCADQYAKVIETRYQTAKTATHGLIKRIGSSNEALRDEASWLAIADSISQTLPPKYPTRQLFLDVSAICRADLKTGIQRVVRSLLLEWLNHPPEGYRIEPVYFTDQGSRWHCRYARQYMLNLMGCPDDVLPDDIIAPQSGDIFFGADLSGNYIIEMEKAGFFTWLQNSAVETYFVVYDLLPILSPHVFHPGTDKHHLAWIQSITRIASGVVCISRAVADEVVEWMRTNNSERLRPFKIGWFHLGADIESSVPTKGMPDDAELLLPILADHPSFLMVGTIEPRKGYAQTLAAFEHLWEEGQKLNLVMVGKQGWMVDSLVDKLNCHPQLGKHLFWLAGISDEYLDKIYAACACLLAASEGEGFGLPLIEAAQKKMPIIARDIPVFREIAGSHAFYFNGLTPVQLADAIQHWLTLYAQDKHIRSDAMPWKTWKRSAEQVLDNIISDQWLYTIEPAIASLGLGSPHRREIDFD